MSEYILYSCDTNESLVANIASKLGITINWLHIKQFSDGESQIMINQPTQQTQNNNIFIVQSTQSLPNNNNLNKLFLLSDTIKQASTTACNITAVIPYFGYARQQKSALLILKLLATAGINKIITVDLHSTQLQKLSPIPLHNISAGNLFISDLKLQQISTLLVVSPDLGGVVRARSFAQLLSNTLSNITIINKQRPIPNQNISMHILGDISKVQNKHCIIIDDLVDTAGTICQAATLLKSHGASSVTAYCTHAILSGNAADSIVNSVLDELIITNSIPLPNVAANCHKIRQICIAGILSDAMKVSYSNESENSIIQLGKTL